MTVAHTCASLRSSISLLSNAKRLKAAMEMKKLGQKKKMLFLFVKRATLRSLTISDLLPKTKKKIAAPLYRNLRCFPKQVLHYNIILDTVEKKPEMPFS